MDSAWVSLLIADALLVLHILYVAFVVVGLILIYIGKFVGWRWVCNPWFRLLHLLAISYVAVQSWFGLVCPLTEWEMAWRAQAGEAVYEQSFIAYWLHKVLFYQAPEWVFMVVYSLFAGCVLLSWFWVRPRSFAFGKNEYTS